MGRLMSVAEIVAERCCSYLQAKVQYEASGLQRPSVRAAMDAIVRFSALRDCAGPAFIEAHSLTVVCANMRSNRQSGPCLSTEKMPSYKPPYHLAQL